MKVKPIGFGGEAALLSGDAMAGLEVRGAMDYSNGFGFAVMGKSRLGDSRMMGGVYQKRVTGYNNTGRIAGRPRRVYFVKMRSYAPTNPQTVAQQANRAKFADARAEWAGLTAVEKSVYNRRANRMGRVGWRLFMSEYLKSH